MLRCPACNVDYESGKRFCRHCGTALVEGSAAAAPQGLPSAQGFADLHAVGQLAGHQVDPETGTGGILDIAFSPCGNLLASASTDRSAILWNVRSGQRLFTLTGLPERVRSVAFSPDGSLLAAAGGAPPYESGVAPGTLMAWQVASGRCVAAFQDCVSEVNSVKFMPDGRIVTGDWNGGVRFWDAAGTLSEDLVPESESTVWSVAVHPGGEYLAVAQEDAKASIWRLSDGRLHGVLAGHQYGVGDVAFGPDGNVLATASHDRTISLWELLSRERMFTLAGHTAAVQSVAFSPDGLFLASGAQDKTVRVWDLVNRCEVACLTDHLDFVNAVAFHPTERLLASAGDDNRVLFWSGCTLN